jgi:hypothetical protein
MRSQTRAMQCAGGKRSTGRSGGWIELLSVFEARMQGQESMGVAYGAGKSDTPSLWLLKTKAREKDTRRRLPPE